VEEVKVGWDMLKSLKLRSRGINFIACPSCSRQNFDVIKTMNELEMRVDDIRTDMSVSVIGCVVNGPGEAKETDVGLAGGQPNLVYIDGKPVGKLQNETLVDDLERLIRARAAELDEARQKLIASDASAATAERNTQTTMRNRLEAIRRMNDSLPAKGPVWQYLEGTVKELLASYGYDEIRMPIVEQTALFKRSIGEVTDIVEKEMYTFDDRNGDSLTLRPEGTASCVRACEEHGLLYNQTQRLWYTGPMFRHERPQKGRYRQFYQIGVETFGIASADIDAEVILMTARLWQQLGLT